MELTITMCHSCLLYLLSRGERFELAVYKYSTTAPNFTHEGIVGYIEMKATFYLKDLGIFSELYNSWYQLPDSTRLMWYRLAKGENLCLK